MMFLFQVSFVAQTKNYPNSLSLGCMEYNPGQKYY